MCFLFTDEPVFTPSRLFVKYGDSASATCSVCPTCTEFVNLERAVGDHVTNGTEITWTIDRMTEWNTQAICYYTDGDDRQCSSDLYVNVYSKFTHRLTN